MIIIGKEFKFEAAHFLPNHPKCGVLHGHTYHLEVEIEGVLNLNGMVMDLHELSKIVNKVISPLDHGCLNNLLPQLSATTCENLVAYLWDEILKGLRGFTVTLSYLKLQEGDGGYAIKLG